MACRSRYTTICAGSSLTTAPCTAPAKMSISRAGSAKLAAGNRGDIGLVGSALTGVSYSLIDAQGNELTTGSVDVNLLGGFDIVLSLPENVTLGYTQLNLQAQYAPGQFGGSSYTHAFQIQEFRRRSSKLRPATRPKRLTFWAGMRSLPLKPNITPAVRCPTLKQTGGCTRTRPIIPRQIGMTSPLDSGRPGGSSVVRISQNLKARISAV